MTHEEEITGLKKYVEQLEHRNIDLAVALDAEQRKIKKVEEAIKQVFNNNKINLRDNMSIEYTFLEIEKSFRKIGKTADKAIRDIYGLTDAYRCPICKHYSMPKLGNPGGCDSTIGCSKANIRCGFEYRSLYQVEGVYDKENTAE